MKFFIVLIMITMIIAPIISIGSSDKNSPPNKSSDEKARNISLSALGKAAMVANSILRYGYNKYTEVYHDRTVQATYRQFSKGTKYCSRDKHNRNVCHNLIRPYHCMFISHRRKQRCYEFLATKTSLHFSSEFDVKVGPCKEKTVKLQMTDEQPTEIHRQYVYDCCEADRKDECYLIAHTRSGTFLFKTVSDDEIAVDGYWLTNGRHRSYATILGHRCMRQMFLPKSKRRNINYR